MLSKQDEKSLDRCVPCSKCNMQPVWGAAFLVCPKCGKESDMNYDERHGSAVRS